MMKIAMTLDGTDAGKSGLGTWVRGVLPRLRAALHARGDSLVVFGRKVDFDAYAPEIGDTSCVALPRICDRVPGSAAFHLVGLDGLAKRCGADVILLPAANRRTTARAKTPTVAVVHDLAQLHVPAKYDFFRMVYLKEVLLRALRSATELVVPSDATRRDLVTFLDRKSRLRVVPNGVDLDRFDASRAARRAVAARNAYSLARPYALYVSRLEHPGKNHVRLVRAFAQTAIAKSHDLVLAGQDWGARSLIEAEIASSGLADRVKLLGRVEDEHLEGLVAGADLTTMPGLCEGFGLPALEALACGVPVAVSSTGALPEVVGDLGVIFDPYREEAIAAALDRAATDATLRKRARDEGPTWARARDWTKTVAGLVAACDEAVS